MVLSFAGIPAGRSAEVARRPGRWGQRRVNELNSFCRLLAALNTGPGVGEADARQLPYPSLRMSALLLRVGVAHTAGMIIDDNYRAAVASYREIAKGAKP